MCSVPFSRDMILFILMEYESLIYFHQYKGIEFLPQTQIKYLKPDGI